MAIAPDDIRAVYTGTTASDAAIQVHIDMAALIISGELGNSGLSTARLDKIQTYLAAHFLFIATSGGGQGGGLKSEKMGESTDEYFSPEETGGYGLAATSFGQQAMVLDTTGKLASKAASTKAPAQFRVV